MTHNLPDYSEVEPPAGTPPEEYTTHERRAEVWRVTVSKGSPARVNKASLARRYDVNRSTIYRDFERLREWAGDTLGEGAKLTTRAVYEKVVGALLDEGEWRDAWTVQKEWNDWLADVGEQYREPRRSELDVRSRHSEVAYTIVREGDDEPLPTTETADGGEAVDYEAIGFTSGPVGVDVEATDDVRGDGGE